MKKQVFYFLTFLFTIYLLSSVQAEVIDTTKVRRTEKVKKTTTEIIGDIPGEIVKLPFYIIDFTIEQVSFNPPFRQLFTWIGTPRPASFISPVLGYNATAGFKFGFGCKFYNVYSDNDYLKTKLYYTTNEYQSYQFQTRSHDLFADDFGIDVYFRYDKRTREDFFGLTNRSSADFIANYHLEKTDFRVQFLFNTFEKSNISIAFGYLGTNLYDGEDPDYLYDLDSIAVHPDYLLSAGSLDNSRYFTYGIMLDFDTRNSPAQPTNGIQFLSEITRYRGVDFSNDMKFIKYTTDIRKYFHLWKKRVLALRVAAGRMNANKSNQKAVPLYILNHLGGEEYLRGYSEGRFVDNDFTLLSVEYRYPIHDFIDLFLFHDQARVYRNMTEEPFFTDWKSSFGGGVRVWKNEDVRAVIQVAKSNETTKLYIDMEAVW